MAKQLLERYEQNLAEDPTSKVFVELAKALLEKGDAARAIDVCQKGLEHHPKSVVGRVLWGKALIQLGRPAEAMEQFDQAVAIDKENPQAYNLIGEVLLRKGLYRSALPLLRRAVALQPNDGRIKQWLEQTQRALAGGPAPVLSDDTLIDTVTDGETAPNDVPPPVAEVNLPSAGALPKVSVADGRRETPMATPAITAEMLRGGPEGRRETPPAMPAVTGEIEQARPTDPSAPAAPPVLMPTPTLEAPAVIAGSATPTDPEGLLRSGPGLSVPPAEPPPPPRPVPPPRRPRGGSGLLEEIPELPVPASGVELPKVELSPQATEAIAKEYERELREKLAQKAEQKGFWARNWLRVASSAAAITVVSVGGAAYVHTRNVNRGNTLASSLAHAKKAIVRDTMADDRDALEALHRAIEMDDRSAEAWALTAYADAMLYAEHGGGPSAKSEAETALGHPRAGEQFPALTLVARYLTSSGQDREALRKQVLNSALNAPEIEALAGQILLERHESNAAVKRLQKALASSPSLVAARAQIELGDYYRQFGDHTHALEFYASAGQLSPKHPGRVLGEAESRLAAGQELAEALTEVQGLEVDDSTPESIASRRALDEGKLLAATGDHKGAIAKLTEGLQKYPRQAFAFQLALGDAQRLDGQMTAAEASIEAALRSHPKDGEAKVALARVLLARDRERDLLARLPAEEDPKLSLLRGEAFLHLRDFKRARAELARTQLNGRYPAEAVAYLALADAEDGDPDRAQAVLEKARASVKQSRSAIVVALGQIEWQRGQTDAARRDFEEASQDPQDYEGACSLGRLWLALGDPAKAAQALTLSVARNASHGEARDALATAELAMGDTQKALEQVEAWRKDDPEAGEADRAFAKVELRLGQLKDADQASLRAVRRLPRDVEAHRVRAEVLYAKGDARTGISELQHANKLDPKDAATFCAIGRAFLREGKSREAESAYAAAQKLSPDLGCAQVGQIATGLPGNARIAQRALGEIAQRSHDVAEKASALATLARAYLAVGDARGAKRAADQSVQLAPTLADGYWALGAAAQKAKDEAAAQKALSRAAELEPSFAAIRLANADFLVHGEDTVEQAVGEYQAYLRFASSKSPDQARVKKLIPTLKKRLASR
jgi:tetratricopeptide (TPR) repeat protein